jgi:uncharacterized membrane protein YphA (DoxX/SURF4 family)
MTQTINTLDYQTSTPRASKAALIIGWILSIIPAGMFIMSAVMKFMKPKMVIDGMVHLGYPEKLVLVLGIVEITCTILYLIPPTSILGAILLTGYLGGAIASHTRIGEPVFTHIGLGIVLWLGLFLREPRLRPLIPLRR